MADFHFLRPLWLLGLPLLALLLWGLWRRRRQQGQWAELCDPWLLPHVLIARPGRAQRHGLALLGLGGILALLALAGPTWEQEPSPAFRNQQALVIALDLSRTMDAGDLKPSRLERARYKIADLLQARKDGQTALLAYADDAYTVTPLTDDRETLRALLSALNTGIMPEQGNRADRALLQAARLLRQAGFQEGHVLLIGDDANDKAQQAAVQLREQGYRVSVLGVGTAQGAPIALPDGKYLEDASGAILIPRLDAAALQALASAGGGRYQTLATDNSDVQTLASGFEQRTAPDEGGGDNTATVAQWRDQGPWLLLPLLPLAALAFRRGLLAVACLSLLLPWPKDAAAWDWPDLWQTPDQQAQQAMQQQDYATAAERFQNPAWKGAAYYRAGQYEQAAQALAGLEDAESQYNRGNALAQAGQYAEAIAAYEAALKQNPQHADARSNKAEVEKLLRRQPPPQQKQSGKDKGKDKDKDKDKDKSKQPNQPAEQSPGQPPSEPQEDKSPGEQKPGEQPSKPAPQQAPSKPGKSPKDSSAQAETADSPAPNEAQQADEAWIKRIPDDPGGLLRRKFLYQQQQRRSASEAPYSNGPQHKQPW
jgi:Ca-activated chloride channel family protein